MIYGYITFRFKCCEISDHNNINAQETPALEFHATGPTCQANVVHKQCGFQLKTKSYL